MQLFFFEDFGQFLMYRLQRDKKKHYKIIVFFIYGVWGQNKIFNRKKNWGRILGLAGKNIESM